jgi:hypothetical protein
MRFPRRNKRSSGLLSLSPLSPISPSSDLNQSLNERIFDHIKVPDLKAPIFMVLVNFHGTVTQVQVCVWAAEVHDCVQTYAQYATFR